MLVAVLLDNLLTHTSMHIELIYKCVITNIGYQFYKILNFQK